MLALIGLLVLVFIIYCAFGPMIAVLAFIGLAILSR